MNAFQKKSETAKYYIRKAINALASNALKKRERGTIRRCCEPLYRTSRAWYKKHHGLFLMQILISCQWDDSEGAANHGRNPGVPGLFASQVAVICELLQSWQECCFEIYHESFISRGPRYLDDCHFGTLNLKNVWNFQSSFLAVSRNRFKIGFWSMHIHSSSELQGWK